MKHLVTPQCRFKCRFLQITDGLWLCPHAAYGEATDRLGAVDEARRLLERQGGYDAVLARVYQSEEAKRAEAREKRQGKQRRLASSFKEG